MTWQRATVADLVFNFIDESELTRTPSQLNSHVRMKLGAGGDVRDIHGVIVDLIRANKIHRVEVGNRVEYRANRDKVKSLVRGSWSSSNGAQYDPYTQRGK